jgi:hypothetical protein
MGQDVALDQPVQHRHRVCQRAQNSPICIYMSVVSGDIWKCKRRLRGAGCHVTRSRASMTGWRRPGLIGTGFQRWLPAESVVPGLGATWLLSSEDAKNGIALSKEVFARHASGHPHLDDQHL